MKRVALIILYLVVINIGVFSLSACNIFRPFSGAVLEYEVYTIEDGFIMSASREQVERKATAVQIMLLSQGFAGARAFRTRQNTLRIEVPDIDEHYGIRAIIGHSPQLEFIHRGNVILTGRNVENAAVVIDLATGGHVVRISLDNIGTLAFKQATSHIGDTVYIYLNIWARTSFDKCANCSSASRYRYCHYY